MKHEYLNKNIIGADETGVGDYLTPLVAAAVMVPAANVDKLIALGITDSKKLTDDKILILFEKIKMMIKSSVRKMSQRQYNFLSNKYNANELKMYLHMSAISAVEERVENTDLVILDAFSNEQSLNKYRNKLEKDGEVKNWKTETKYVTKGEMEHVSVAAASIVARTAFINMMKEQNKKYRMIFPLGTNDKVVEIAREFIKKHGEAELYNVAKLSFKTTDKVK